MGWDGTGGGSSLNGTGPNLCGTGHPILVLQSAYPGVMKAGEAAVSETATIEAAVAVESDILSLFCLF